MHVNPDKLLHSKWTARDPVNKEKHFVVSALFRDDADRVIDVELEAVLTKKRYRMAWRELKDQMRWLIGWQ